VTVYAWIKIRIGHLLLNPLYNKSEDVFLTGPTLGKNHKTTINVVLKSLNKIGCMWASKNHLTGKKPAIS
jgi:hypothetical protein